jgi:hypothetical protein
LSLSKVRQKYGTTTSDEELLLRIYAGPEVAEALPADGAPRLQLDGKRSLLRLIEQLGKKKDCKQIYIRHKDFSLRLEDFRGRTNFRKTRRRGAEYAR